ALVQTSPGLVGVAQTVVNQGQPEPIQVPASPLLDIGLGETLYGLVELAGAVLRQSQGMEVPGRLSAGDGLVRPLDGPSGIDWALARHRAGARQDIGLEGSLRLRRALDHALAEAVVALAISPNQEQTGVGEGVIVQRPCREVSLCIFGSR